MKKQKIQLLILLIVLGVAALAFFGIRSFSQKKEKAEEDTTYTAYEVDPSDITNITCHNDAGSFAIDYDAGSDTWTFTDQPDEKVDATQAKKLAGDLKKITSTDQITDVDDPSEFGFGSDPSVTIDVTTKDGKTTTLYIGDNNATISRYYFRVGDASTIYTVDSSFYSDFNVDQPSLVATDTASTSSSSSAPSLSSSSQATASSASSDAAASSASAG